MPPAIIAAGVGAVASIGGGLLASHAQSRASSQAADSAASNNAVNNALQQQVYAQNQAYLSPYAARGNDAGNAINSLLGLGTGPTTQQYGAAGSYGTPDASRYTGPSDAQISALTGNGIIGDQEAAINARDAFYNSNPTAQHGALFYPTRWRGSRIAGEMTAPPVAPAPSTAPHAATHGAPTGTAQTAFQNYLNSTGYRFQMDQGTQAINQGYAARGSLQSGAALKALQTYGQNTGTSFFNQYLGLLSNQQSAGLTGASAIAGVGQNYAGAVNANNNAGSAAQQNALYNQGNANANLYGNIAGSIGGVANAFGSSYGRRG